MERPDFFATTLSRIGLGSLIFLGLLSVGHVGLTLVRESAPGLSLSDRSFVHTPQSENYRPLIAAPNDPAQRLVAQARKWLYVRELTGRNDGKEVEMFLASAGLKRGNPWCSAFTGFCHLEEKLPVPKGFAWSPAWFPSERTHRSDSRARTGQVMGLYYPNLGRIGHTGIVVAVHEKHIRTVEGNTTDRASIDELNRNGGGVHEKIRPKGTITHYADWTQ